MALRLPFLSRLESGDLALIRRLLAENARDFVGRYFLAFFAMAIFAATTGASAWLMRDVVDGIFLQGDSQMLVLVPIAMGALFTAHHLKAKAIVALTESGSTALWMSRHSVRMPIFAVTSKLASQRKMTLYRNVRPLLVDTSAERDTALAQAEADLKARGVMTSGDVYAITVGEPMGQPGGTNTLKICRAA